MHSPSVPVNCNDFKQASVPKPKQFHTSSYGLIEFASFRVLLRAVLEFCQNHSSSNPNLTFLVLAEVLQWDMWAITMWFLLIEVKHCYRRFRRGCNVIKKSCSVLRKSQSYMEQVMEYWFLRVFSFLGSTHLGLFRIYIRFKRCRSQIFPCWRFPFIHLKVALGTSYR